MKKFLHKVTVTGADDSTDIAQMVEIQKQYPFVEFGILLSKKYSLGGGANRFPSKEWLNKLVASSGQLSLSGHLCGQWVNEILLGKFPSLDLVHGNFPNIFSRFQINTHGEYHKIDFEKLDYVLKDLRSNFQSVIFQLDNVNDVMVPMWNRNHRNISGLFDLSHGAGVLPSNWPKPITGMYCGYAGGLSPENVVEQIEKIYIANGDNDTWIDAETHLRSDGDRKFDLNKVIDFLEKSKPYIYKK
jgi:hypothetical protein